MDQSQTEEAGASPSTGRGGKCSGAGGKRREERRGGRKGDEGRAPPTGWTLPLTGLSLRVWRLSGSQRGVSRAPERQESSEALTELRGV